MPSGSDSFFGATQLGLRELGSAKENTFGGGRFADLARIEDFLAAVALASGIHGGPFLRGKDPEEIGLDRL